jgi:hypothetical protein
MIPSWNCLPYLMIYVTTLNSNKDGPAIISSALGLKETNSATGGMTKRSPKKRYNEEITLIQPCHEKIQKKKKKYEQGRFGFGTGNPWPQSYTEAHNFCFHVSTKSKFQFKPRGKYDIKYIGLYP